MGRNNMIGKRNSEKDVHLLSLPQRLSLVDEVATIIRDGIRTGVWKNFLPGERQMSAELRVSRPTIKRAVEILASEGVVSNIGRRRRKILRPATTPRAGSNVVGVLLPVPLEKTEPHFLLRVDYLRAGLAREGMELQIVNSARFYSTNPGAALRDLVKEHNATVWLIVRSTFEMQRWFEENKIPCLIMGTEFEGVNLCSIDFEMAAVSRHAACLLASRGHKTIGFVMNLPYCAGDVASREAFLKGADSLRGNPVKTVVMDYNGAKQNLCALLDRQLRTAAFPTGFLISHANTAISLVSHLAQRGKIAGRDYAYICREDDPLLEHLLPETAHYKFDFPGYSKRLLELVKKIAQNRRIAKRHLRMMPEFIDARSANLTPHAHH